MTLIICLDKMNGISFNNRRQSRDSAVVERMCNIASTSKLHIKEYSKFIFSLPCSYINVCENPLENAGCDDFCFLEIDISDISYDNIDKIIIYRWDKIYPQDKKYNIELDDWKLISTDKFKGTSHDEITEEVYVK